MDEITTDNAQDLIILTPFMPEDELKTIWHCSQHGEEQEYFKTMLATQAAIIEGMPQTDENDSSGDQMIAFLHYFGPSYDAYIFEKDAGSPDAGQQIQAFGWTRFAHMPECAELGYISIQELIENGIELDLHYTPMTLKEIKANYA